MPEGEVDVKYGVNLEHFDEDVNNKIENRNREIYPSMASYVLATIRNLDSNLYND